MAQNYDLNNTGPEVQERLDQVPVTQRDLETEVQSRIDGDANVTQHCEQYTNTETQRAQGVESRLQQELETEVQSRIDGDANVTQHCEQYTDAETQRAQGVENDLQEQINNIVSKDTTIGLTVSPAAVFADGTDKVVTFVATSSPTKATVVFDGGAPQEGTRLEYQVIVNSATPTTVSKTAQFTVQSVSKGSKTATVAPVFPIY